MSRVRHRCIAAVGVSAVAMLVAATPAAAAPVLAGPNTTTAPYVLPLAPGVEFTSLLTVDDAGSAANGYEMVGIPDGLGAYRKGNQVTVLMNHELPVDRGIVRRHGQRGAFVSELQVTRNDDAVVAGQDLVDPGVRYWDYLTGAYAAAPNGPGVQADGDLFPAYPAAFGRFCSGALTDEGQLYNNSSRNGYRGQLYFANEEVGAEGRAFAVTMDGQAHQLPRLGLFSWENTIAASNRSDTTLVMGDEDGAIDKSELWAYVGTKQRGGSPVDQAGLTNGTNFVADMLDETVGSDAQFRAKFGKGTPAPFDLAAVDWDKSGAAQNAAADVAGLGLSRIEDGAFDPRNPNDYYFVTTAGGAGTGNSTAAGDGGGLWRASWKDIERPELGGTLTLLLDGTEGLTKPDNMDIDGRGNILIQEDPGNNPYVARIFAYRIADGALAPLATFDPALFTPGRPGFITADEESSGVLDVSDLYGGPGGAFLLDAQVHAPPATNAAEFVERGQLLRMTVRDWDAVYGG